MINGFKTKTYNKKTFIVFLIITLITTIILTNKSIAIPIPLDPLNLDANNTNFTDTKLDSFNVTNFLESGKCPWPVLELLARLSKKDNVNLQSDRTETHEKEVDFWKERYTAWIFKKRSTKDSKNLHENLKKYLENCRFDLSFLTPRLLKQLPAPLYKRLLEDLASYMTTFPEKDVVAIYMYAQWVAMKRAEQVMISWQNVLREHPSLDYTVVRPPVQYATAQKIRFELKAIESFLKELGLREDVALVAFVSDECLYCAAQIPVLEILRKKYNIHIKYIKTNERPDIAKAFNIEAVPEVWLAIRGKGFERVSAGLRTVDYLKRAIVLAYEKLTNTKVVPDIWKVSPPEESLFPKSSFENPELNP